MLRHAPWHEAQERHKKIPLPHGRLKLHQSVADARGGKYKQFSLDVLQGFQDQNILKHHFSHFFKPLMQQEHRHPHGHCPMTS